MAVTGDFHRLQLLREQLKACAAGEARKAVIGALRDESVTQCVACFKVKRDPYGRPWPPRPKPADWAILDKTGALIDSVRAIATATAVRLSMLGYGVYHWQPDRPGQKLPQRAMLPTRRQGLGPIWGDAFVRRSGQVMRAFMRMA